MSVSQESICLRLLSRKTNVTLDELPGHFLIWLASPEAEFLKGKYVWVNWDVDELKAREKEIVAPNKLVTGLAGWN